DRAHGRAGVCRSRGELRGPPGRGEGRPDRPQPQDAAAAGPPRDARRGRPWQGSPQAGRLAARAASGGPQALMPAPIPSPNIWNDPDIYEVENHAVDRDERIEAAMLSHRPIRDARLLDLGCGSGFHLERWVDYGALVVVGVEPHQPLIEQAR